jgi:Cyclic nucleotide-binding domain
LNLGLGIINGFVHGLRLNYIEFFKWALSEEGYPFKAFRKMEVEYLLLSFALVADVVILRRIPKQRPVVRFVCMSILFAIETGLIVALVRSPLNPVYRPQDLPRIFWIQILICCWWVLAARELVSSLALLTALSRSAVKNKFLSNVIAASIYICAGLVILAFVFEFPIQGLVATSGITGEQLLTQGATLEAVQFVFSGVIEATREVQDGRKLKVGKLGPGDSFGILSLLTGMHTEDVTNIRAPPGVIFERSGADPPISP